MTKEEIEIYEKLIESSITFTKELTEVKKGIVQLDKSVQDVRGFVLGLYKYFKEAGGDNFRGVLEADAEKICDSVEVLLKENNKPVVVMLKAIAAVTGLLTVIATILYFFIGK